MTDSASNNVKFARVSEYIRLACDCHQLHLLLTVDSLLKQKDCLKLIKRCKAIIGACVWRGNELKEAAIEIESLQQLYNDILLDERFPINGVPVSLKNEVICWGMVIFDYFSTMLFTM